jgi:hypothetical protein
VVCRFRDRARIDKFPRFATRSIIGQSDAWLHGRRGSGQGRGSATSRIGASAAFGSEHAAFDVAR